MSTITTDIVARLWNLCNILKDDGVTYHQYVTELTYLLFLKMAKETGVEDQIPAGCRWDDLERATAPDRLRIYKLALVSLGEAKSRLVQEIFANASSFIKKPTTLSTLVAEIDKLDWYSARQEGLGDLYEGLLEKNANEKKSGAGQYFTPRPLIDSMVAVMQPTLDDIIQDPAAGTGGFLIAANRWLREHSDPDTWTEAQQRKYRRNTFYGMEHVQDAHRLALMNLMLHGLDSDPDAAGIHYGDTLGQEGEALCKQGATLILTNPPFGTKKGGGLPTRNDFTFPTSNKQFCFLQHVYRSLKPGGRAAVVQPDNVLFEGNTGRQIRADLMDKCNLHTILRLPTGIFYAQGVKTNVLFFTRGETDKAIPGKSGSTTCAPICPSSASAPCSPASTSLSSRLHLVTIHSAPLKASPSVRIPASLAASAVSPATGSPSAETASTSPGSRTRAKAPPTSYPSRLRSRRRRWANLKRRLRNCGGF
jgi:type I restriction enzyme M protein